ncbi:MAG: methyl-accepting chemotaxis protein [Magnetococcus sp. YQC-3]
MNLLGLTLRLLLPAAILLAAGVWGGLLAWPLAVVLLLAVALVMGWLELGLFRPLRDLQEAMGRTHQGGWDETIPGLEREDALGAVARTLVAFREEQRQQLRRLHLHDDLTAFLTLQQGPEKVSPDFSPASAGSQPLDSLTNLQQGIERIILFTQDIYESFLDLRNQIQAIAGRSDGASEAIAGTATAIGSIDTRLADITQLLHTMEGSMERVASAVHEMGDSFEGIHRLTERVTSESVEANRLSQNARQGIVQLSQSALAIGKVVAVIDSIAEQTNILALNAAIEAAAAGAFGAGFAVVANEVKELAQQTSRATRMIADHIQEIQTMSESSVSVAQQVSAIIEHLSAANREVDQQVTIQTTAARQMLESVQGLSRSAAEILRHAGQLSDSTRAVATATQATSGLAREIADSSQSASLAAEQVAHQSDAISDLSKMALGFVSALRSGASGAPQRSEVAPELSQVLVATHHAALAEMVRRLSQGLLSAEGPVSLSEPFALRRIYAAHMAFTERLLHALHGVDDPAQGELPASDDCPVARLLPGGKRSAIPDPAGHRALLQLHAGVHEAAAEVLAMLRQGSLAEARQAMARFHATQEELFSRLNALYFASSPQEMPRMLPG